MKSNIAYLLEYVQEERLHPHHLLHNYHQHHLHWSSLLAASPRVIRGLLHRICVGLAYTGTCATLYLPVWEIYSVLFRTTITQLKKQNKKHKYWTKSFLATNFVCYFFFVVLSFTSDACCCWCVLTCMPLLRFSLLSFHWERRQKI